MRATKFRKPNDSCFGDLYWTLCITAGSAKHPVRSTFLHASGAMRCSNRSDRPWRPSVVKRQHRCRGYEALACNDAVYSARDGVGVKGVHSALKWGLTCLIQNQMIFEKIKLFFVGIFEGRAMLTCLYTLDLSHECK